MKLFQKFLALTLAFSLLGQNALFAQAVSVEDLKSMQQQANQDVAEMGLSDTEKTFLTIGGTVFLASVVFAAIHKHSMKLQQERASKILRENMVAHQAEINKMQQQANAEVIQHQTQVNKLKEEFTQTLTQKEAELAAVREELRITTIKKEGLAKSAATQKAKRETALAQLQARELELQEIIARQNKSIEFYNDLFQQFSAVDHTITQEMDKYLKLFDETVPEAERNLLRTALPHEPWFKAATKEQQEMFLKYVDDAMSLTHVGKTTAGASHVLSNGAVRFLPQAEKSLYQRLVVLGKHVASKRNIFTFGLLALLGVSAHNAQAQQVQHITANRINTNFNLFLNASEQDLKRIADNPQAAKVCVQGAYAIHMMKALPQEEIKTITSMLKEDGQARRQNTYNNLRNGVSY